MGSRHVEWFIPSELLALLQLLLPPQDLLCLLVMQLLPSEQLHVLLLLEHLLPLLVPLHLQVLGLGRGLPAFDFINHCVEGVDTECSVSV